jgi:Tol biopolymer transport system component
MWVDSTGKEVGRFGDPGLYLQPHSSPDGSLFGFVRPEPDTGKMDVWIMDPSRNTTSRSTFVDAATIYFAFSPDAKRIAVATISGTASAGFWIQPINGSGIQEKLDKPNGFGTITSWSPNGRYLFFMVQNTATRQDVYYIDLNGDKQLKPFIQSPANDTSAVLSPNGKWLAYMSDESGKYEVYVTAFPGPGGKWQISSGGGNVPSWSADGKQLYYTIGDKLMRVTIENQDTFQFGAPAQMTLHMNEFSAVGPVGPGERFPALKALSGGQSLPQEVILNWTGTLKQ